MPSDYHQHAIEADTWDRQGRRIGEIRRAAARRLWERLEVILKNFEPKKSPINRIWELVCKPDNLTIDEIFRRMLAEKNTLLS